MAVDPGDTPRIPVGEFETYEVPDLNLKHQTEEELLDHLINDSEWTDEDRQRIADAYALASHLHADDTYRGQPYIYHLLRSANRVVRYMGVKGIDIVAAMILHDSVEDHAAEMVDVVTTDERELQSLALNRIAIDHNQRTADIVRMLTNEPDEPGVELSYEEKLAKYAAKVAHTTETFEGWVDKFSDWCENGLGVVHSEFGPNSEKAQHSRLKYGGEVLLTFARGYNKYADQLNPAGANYVATQLTLGFQRLFLNLRHES